MNLLAISILALNICCSGSKFGSMAENSEGRIVLGDEKVSLYLPLLLGKSVGGVSTHTSIINNVHLVDTLLAMNVNVVKAFGPEHGFRGSHGAGDHVDLEIDSSTGVEIISLYGKNKKPTSENFSGLDIVIFDIQDVGARFYTYISTLFYVMERCAEENIPLIILDRPNPHGSYEDGPILDLKYKSFVGICEIPVIHGLTVGEFAMMVNGEGWLSDAMTANIIVIEMSNYNHNTHYVLPVTPSPNLQDMQAIYLYPSLCFFEGTIVSVGRGTGFPFKTYGYPGMIPFDTTYIPVDIQGVVTNPPFKGELCNGIYLEDYATKIRNSQKINIELLLTAYQNYPEKKHFFTPFFDKLAGTDALRIQIENGYNEEQIRASWENDLLKFRTLKTKYQLYQ